MQHILNSFTSVLFSKLFKNGIGHVHHDKSYHHCGISRVQHELWQILPEDSETQAALWSWVSHISSVQRYDFHNQLVHIKAEKSDSTYHS